MGEQSLTMSDVARRMGTSRQHVSKLLDPASPSNVSFQTIAALAAAVQRRVHFELQPVHGSGSPRELQELAS